MDLGSVLKLLHILSVLWTVTGVVGRDVIIARAAKADEIGETNTIMKLADPFERLMARPGSLFILLTGLLTAWAQGWRLFGPGSIWLLLSILLFLGLIPVIAFALVPKGRTFESALDDANKRGVVTPELRSAFGGRLVAFGRNYELVVIVLATALMVLKPF